MDTGQKVKASYAQAVRSPPSSLTEAFSASALPRFVLGIDRNRMRKTPKVSSMQEDKKTKPPDNTVERLTEHASEEKGSNVIERMTNGYLRFSTISYSIVKCSFICLFVVALNPCKKI